jgi:ferredoxin
MKADHCKTCHLILAQGSDEQMAKLNGQGYDFIHIDSEYSDFSCTDCHAGEAIKN